MTLVSAPIAVAAATATTFLTLPRVSKLSISYVFYTTSDALEGEEIGRPQITRGDVESNYVAPVSQVTRGDVVSNYVAPVAPVSQVTTGLLVFNGTDDVGLTVDALDPLFVPCNTDAATTVEDLIVEWNGSPAHFAVATMSVDVEDDDEKPILSFNDDQTHTVIAHSPATADITGITNTVEAVEEVEEVADDVGWEVDALDPLFVPSNVDDDTTATDLMAEWNGSPAHAAVATASVNLSGAPSYSILTFLDDQVHTAVEYSPDTAGITGITNTTEAVELVEDDVGLTVDALDPLFVASITNDDTTAAALDVAWDASEDHADVATATIDLAGATSYIILTFADFAVHTVIEYSPATAGVTSITNTQSAVAITAGTRDIAVSRVDYGGTAAGAMTMPITGATATALASRTWKTIELGVPAQGISVTCTAVSTPASATHYRIWIDA